MFSAKLLLCKVLKNIISLLSPELLGNLKCSLSPQKHDVSSTFVKVSGREMDGICGHLDEACVEKYGTMIPKPQVPSIDPVVLDS